MVGSADETFNFSLPYRADRDHKNDVRFYEAVTAINL
jgi:hypothetical protein